jgi:mono/diheme cytochrome c family protein
MNRRIAATLLLALVLGAGVSACGGDDETGNGTDTTATDTNGGETDGREVFVSECGTCHTLADAGTSGTTGPVLDGAGLDEATVEQQVREGGGGMPSFEGTLSDEEIAAVAAYVAAES